MKIANWSNEDDIPDKQQMSLFYKPLAVQYGNAEWRAGITLALRAGIFRMVPKRKAGDRDRIVRWSRAASYKGVSIDFAGVPLDQFDRELFDAILEMMAEAESNHIRVTLTMLCRALGYEDQLGGSIRNKVAASLDRLRIANITFLFEDDSILRKNVSKNGGFEKVVVTVPEDGINLPLIYYERNGRDYDIYCSPRLKTVCDFGGMSYSNLSKRRSLGDHQLAKCLEGFYSTHSSEKSFNGVITRSLSFLLDYVDSNRDRNSKAKMTKAHELLVRANILEEYVVEKGKEDWLFKVKRSHEDSRLIS